MSVYPSAQCMAMCLMEDTLPPGAIMEPSPCSAYQLSSSTFVSFMLYSLIHFYPLGFPHPQWDSFTLLYDSYLAFSTVVTETIQSPSDLK